MYLDLVHLYLKLSAKAQKSLQHKKTSIIFIVILTNKFKSIKFKLIVNINNERRENIMKNKFLKALKYNMFGLFIFGVSYFLKYDMNKTHTKEILLMIFLGEVSYWLTVIIGSLIIKKLKS